MKMLFFTDTHIRGTTPISRLDNFVDTLKIKINEIITIAKEERVDYILHGGDMFDRAEVANTIIRQFGKILMQAEAPIYMVAGNHDIFGYNPETIHRTALGLFEAFGIVSLLQPGERILLAQGGLRVQLTGQHFHPGIDQEDVHLNYLVSKEDDCDYAIHLVHGMLLPKPFLPDMPYTITKSILNTEADLTLSGHYHEGFGIVDVGGKLIVNPGSVARLRNTPSERARIPQVALINISHKGIEVNLRKLSSAQPGRDVFNLEKSFDSCNQEVKLESFIREIYRAGEIRQVELNEIIKDIAYRHGLDQSIRDEAINRIALAQEYLLGGKRTGGDED